MNNNTFVIKKYLIYNILCKCVVTCGSFLETVENNVHVECTSL